MNAKVILSLVFLFGSVSVHSVNAEMSKISFIGKKGWVVTKKERSTVLSVAEKYLSRSNDDFIAKLDELKSPFPAVEVLTPKEEVELVEDDSMDEEPAQPTPIVYEDSSILKVVGSNFSKQVRGTLSRGNNNYIQLQGGNLLKNGSTFPVRLPEMEDKTYIVKLSEVTSESYTLSLGIATLTLTYSDAVSGIEKAP
ncbi:MAG: hypothetical protein ACSHYA_15700 [Opitutaceae bacterium]